MGGGVLMEQLSEVLAHVLTALVSAQDATLQTSQCRVKEVVEAVQHLVLVLHKVESCISAVVIDEQHEVVLASSGGDRKGVALIRVDALEWACSSWGWSLPNMLPHLLALLADVTWA
jgi:hypothetical protein